MPNPIKWWLTLSVLLLMAAPGWSQEKKFSIKTATTEPPKELQEPIRQMLQGQSAQFFDPAGKLVCELWFCKELPAEATAEQVKNGLTFRELKESQLVAAVRFAQPWQDYRKQKIKPGVYTFRLGFQPADGDHSGKSAFTEFLVLSAASKDQNADPMATKALLDMSGKSIGSGHPGVFMLFPNNKPGSPTVESKPREHWVVNFGCAFNASGNRGMLGFGLTLVGEADD
jgi:hypothetical protein